MTHPQLPHPDISKLSADDLRFLSLAYDRAAGSFAQGGLPIGAVLARGSELLGTGHNQRIQKSDPIAHGEMDCLRNAGRQRSYKGTTLYTTLSPCMMCAGTIVQFRIPRVVIGENRNFGGNEDFLRQHGVEVAIADDANCILLMKKFIAAHPDLWAEDIGAD